jgi:hypothetical protein
VSPVKYELGLYISEDDIFHSHCRENLNSYKSCAFLLRYVPLIFFNVKCIFKRQLEEYKKLYGGMN